MKKTQEILNKLQSKGIIGRWKKRREIKENQDRLEVLEEEIAYLKERLSEKKVKYEQASIKAHQQSQKVSEIEDTERWYQRVEEWVRQGKGEEELWSTVLDNPGWMFFEIPGTDWSTIIAVRLTTGDPEQPPELQNETQLTAQAYCQLIHPKTRIISPATETKSCSLSSLIDRMQPYSIVNPKLRYTLHSEIEKSLKSLYKPPKESLTWLKNQTKKDKLPITTTSG